MATTENEKRDFRLLETMRKSLFVRSAFCGSFLTLPGPFHLWADRSAFFFRIAKK